MVCSYTATYPATSTKGIQRIVRHTSMGRCSASTDGHSAHDDDESEGSPIGEGPPLRPEAVAPMKSNEAARFPVDIEKNIFDHLFYADRSEATKFLYLSTVHHKRYIPRIYHTVIITEKNFSHLRPLFYSELRSFVKRIVFARFVPDPIASDLMKWPGTSILEREFPQPIIHHYFSRVRMRCQSV